MLPFNLHHLGPAAYGLWMLTASITLTSRCSTSDTAARIVKFVAQYRAAARRARAQRDRQHAVLRLQRARPGRLLASSSPSPSTSATSSTSRRHQAQTGKWMLLIIGVYVALELSVQQSSAASSAASSATTSTTSSAIVSSVIVARSSTRRCSGRLRPDHAGRGDDERADASRYFIYRRNAYKVFPALRIRPSLFRAQPPARGHRLQRLRRRSSTGRTS